MGQKQILLGILSLLLSINSNAAIISTDVSAGMSIKYKDSITNSWLVDATESKTGVYDASVHIAGSTTGITLDSIVNTVIDSPNHVTSTITLQRDGVWTGPITTSGYPNAVWSNSFHVSYFADDNSLLTYSWDINAPGMLFSEFGKAMADVIIDVDLNVSNGMLQHIRAANNPGNHSNSASIDLLSGNNYDFFVTMYHYHSFSPNYDISSEMFGEFSFDFKSVSVSEPSIFLLVVAGFIGMKFSRNRLKK